MALGPVIPSNDPVKRMLQSIKNAYGQRSRLLRNYQTSGPVIAQSTPETRTLQSIKEVKNAGRGRLLNNYQTPITGNGGLVQG